MKAMTHMMIITMGVVLLYTGAPWAGSVTLPHPDFTAGTPAVADQVDANFSAIAEAVNDNDTRISTNTASIGTKQNTVTGTCPDGQSIRTINPDGSVVCEPDDVGGAGDGHSLDSANGSIPDVVFVSDSGNVGIGTTTPSADDALTIFTTGNRTGIRLDTGVCHGASADTGEARLVLDESNEFHIFNSCTGPTSSIVLRSDGTIDISASRLSLNGQEITASTPPTNSLENTANLEPLSYESMDSESGQDQKYGLVAQDLEEVFPELVTEDDEGNKRLKNGPQFQMLIIKAIKELKEKNAELEAELNSLKDRF